MPRPDLTVLALPAFVAAMGVELWWQRTHPADPGLTRAGDYELNDTIGSLTMGIGSLIEVVRRIRDRHVPAARGRRVGLHLLLEPPPGARVALAVVRTRGAPQQ